MPDITLTANDGAPMRAYLATPAVGNGPWPGVVVIHDAMGLGVDTKVNADHLAAAGYLALAPDIYSRGGTLRCVKSTFQALFAGKGQAFTDIETAREWLVDQPTCSGKTGIIGFCMGGGFALLSAQRGFDASSVNYGQLPDNLDEVLEGACPIVGSFGARDLTLKGAAPKLQAALDKAGIASDVKEYPHAGHSFLNRFNVGPLTPLLKVTGMSYHHASAEDAWRRILGFFDTHLRG